MRSLAILMVVLGFGSLLLPLFDMQFTFMAWADAYQPFGGLIVGAIGAALLAAPYLMKRDAAPAQPQSQTQEPPPAA